MNAYDGLKNHFADDSRVTINSGTGAQGIKVNVKNKDKMIIIFYKGDLLLQMPSNEAKVQEAGENILPTQLRGWFGPAAGMPESSHDLTLSRDDVNDHKLAVKHFRKRRPFFGSYD